MNTIAWYLAPPQGQFSLDMFSNGIYGLIMTIMAGLVFTMLIIYYYVLNHALNTAKWANRTTYFLFMAFTAFVVGIIATSQPTSMLYKAIGAEYGIGTTWIYGLVTAFESAILFFALSYLVRILSRNASHLPF
ncbi:MAG: hypothetical protein RI894_266 [Bacteroidota bacterium]|jgi:hypothetical protein